MNLRTHQAYNVLRHRITEELKDNDRMRLGELKKILQSDEHVDWAMIAELEKKRNKDGVDAVSPLDKHFKEKLIRLLSPPRRFGRGGDRCSENWRELRGRPQRDVMRERFKRCCARRTHKHRLTTAMSPRTHQAYNALRQRINEELEGNDRICLDELKKILQSDEYVDWVMLVELEKKRNEDGNDTVSINKNFKRNLIKLLSPPRRFGRGGDRCSENRRKLRERRQPVVTKSPAEAAQTAVVVRQPQPDVTAIAEEPQRDPVSAEHTPSAPDVTAARLLATHILRRFLEQKRAAVRVDVVPAPAAPLRGAAQVCSDCRSRKLVQRVGVTPAYSDVAAKREVRKAFVAFVKHCGVTRPLLLVVDAWLPFTTDGDPAHGSYLTEDLLASVPGLTPEQIYSPNVDPVVVEDLRQRCGLAHAAHECVCLFLQRREQTLRTLGGFVACMLDVWGGFDHGARRPLKWLAQRRLLRGECGAGVMFCCSDRSERTLAGNLLVAREKNQTDISREVLGVNGYRRTTFPYAVPVKYGQTGVERMMELAKQT